jgi:hypothetical protein
MSVIRVSCACCVGCICCVCYVRALHELHMLRFRVCMRVLRALDVPRWLHMLRVCGPVSMQLYMRGHSERKCACASMSERQYLHLHNRCEGVRVHACGMHA